MPQIEEAQPKYLQIAHYIRDQILRGDLRPGDEVPSERQLAADWKVSRPTAIHGRRQIGTTARRRRAGTGDDDVETGRVSGGHRGRPPHRRAPRHRRRSTGSFNE